MITEKGFKILQGLNEINISLQDFPQQIYHSNLFEESKKEELTDESKIIEMTEALKEMALSLGAFKVGIATTETLSGGPPSTDLTYVLPEAKSVVCFALALDQNLIYPYFRKVDHESLETNKVMTTTIADGIALEMANFLQQAGYKAVPQSANFVYRRDTENWLLDLHPLISHRYLAVRSGIGHFGYSGNIITKEYGSAIVLVSVVTDAELIQTDSLPAEENYCDECNLCLSVCLSGYVDPVEKVTVTLGGKEFSYGKRRNNSRCLLVCMGLTGLNASGKWSTWSPGRFRIPEKDGDCISAIPTATKAYLERPKFKDGFFVPIKSGSRMEYTCSNCHLICHPDKEVRTARYKMLIESGVVVQEPDGTRSVVFPEEAKEYLNSMPLERRKLYESIPEGKSV
jgi:epoxyqueuosine reductase QueG